MSDIYSVVAYAARYWFTFLAAVIIWRSIKWVRRDAVYMSGAQRHLPDAGFIGEWVVVASDSGTIQVDMLWSAPRDGWIGSARACDVRLKEASVAARTARFYLRKDGVHVLPRKSGGIEVDGEPVRREAVLRHGAMLKVGGVTLQLRLFAGILLDGEITGTEEMGYWPEDPAEERPREEALPVDAATVGAAEAAGPAVTTKLPKPNLVTKKRRNRRGASETKPTDA